MLDESDTPPVQLNQGPAIDRSLKPKASKGESSSFSTESIDTNDDSKLSHEASSLSLPPFVRRNSVSHSISQGGINVLQSIKELTSDFEVHSIVYAPSTINSRGDKLPRWRFALLSISLSLGLFLSFMDGSITSTALFTIGVEFDSLATINWVALAYTLSDVGLATVFTTVADVIGRFQAYVAAQIIFIAFSIACGFAQNLNQLVAFRCLQGVGGSGLYTLAMVIWQEACSPELRRWMGASIGFVVAAAGIMGPILGGVISSGADWRWIFWINPPILVVSIVLFFVAWPRSGRLTQHVEAQSASKLDIVGCFLLIAGSVLTVFAFQNAGQKTGNWNKAIFLGPIIAGVCSLALLAAWETFISRRLPHKINPVFPPHLLKQRRYTATMINSLLMGFGLAVVIYNVPLRFQAVNGKSALAAGVGLVAMLCATAVGSFLGGAMSSRKDFLCHTIVVGSALMALGTGLLSTLSANLTVEKKVYAFQVLVGLGFGLTVSSSSILANVECKPRDHAVAQGIIAQARVLGSSLGIAAGSAILGEKIQAQLAGIVPMTDLKSLFSTTHDLSASQLRAIRHTYSNAFSVMLLMTAIVAAVAVIAACFAWNSSKQEFLNRVRHLEDNGEEGDISHVREEMK